MRIRVLVAGLVAIAAVAGAGPATAKIDIAKAAIAGPGLEHTLRIEAPETYGLWDSGIDTEGGLDEAPAESVEDLGLTPADLGARYRVTYGLGIGRARQDLYPYAAGGPVTYSPPGQVLGRRPGTPDFLRNSPIVAGWYQSGPELFHYLVDHGLPDTNPAPTLAPRQVFPDSTPRSQAVSWRSIVFALVAVATLSVAV
jgi:hypothetical protein